MNRFKSILTALILGFVCLGAGSPASAEDAAALINQGNQALQSGNLDDAISKYETAATLEPENYHLAYNRGIAHYRKGELETAEQWFANALNSSDPNLAAKAGFNLGNCQYSRAVQAAAEQPESAMPLLENAIKHYRSALDSNRADSDARVNIELARKLLNQLKKQQEQQQQDQQQNQQQQSENSQSNDQQSEQLPSEQGQSEQHKSNSDQNDPENQDSENQDSEQQQDSNEQNSDQQNSDQQNSDQQNSGQQDSEQQDSDQQNSEQQNSEQDQSDQKQTGSDAQQPEREPQNKDEQQDQSGSQGEYPDDQQQEDQQQQQNSGQPQGGEKPEQQNQPAAQPGQQPQPEQEEQDQQPQMAQGDPQQQSGGQQTPGYSISDAGQLQGTINKEEAMKMLQAIRDRDLMRRMQKLNEKRRRQVPVERDW